MTLPNTFGTKTAATGQQLDSNFATVAAYINDPTNRNNYAVDSGSTNTIALSFVPGLQFLLPLGIGLLIGGLMSFLVKTPKRDSSQFEKNPETGVIQAVTTYQNAL